MDQNAFLSGLASILQVEAIRIDQPLTDGVWDSVAIMSTLAFVGEQYDIDLSPSKLSRCTTPQDIYALIASSGAR